MYLAVRDRRTDRYIDRFPKGDILKAAPDGGGRWKLADNAAFDIANEPWWRFPIGSLAVVEDHAGEQHIVTSAFGTSEAASGGLLWLAAETAEVVRSEEVYSLSAPPGRPEIARKIAGLGDVEAWEYPIPTATATGVLSATPSLPAPPTAVPTGAQVSVYLPTLLHEHCTPTQRRMDAALVIDASSSMLQSTVIGRTKLAAAIDAAQVFLSHVHLETGDQAAVIAFNGDAWLRARLTTDRAVLYSALTGIQTAQYTRIDRGIAVAHEELTGSRRRADNIAVMIVLTDGKANPVPVDVAIDEARRAKGSAIVIFTVGLGADLNVDGLRAMASAPDYFYIAPDAERLAEIYEAIAVAVPCAANTFWGRR
jgi:Mg-chelatase subunit ChlD